MSENTVMTSLARQLKRLAVNTEALAPDRDLERRSLLFDSKQAASIDLDDFYEIGYIYLHKKNSQKFL